MKVVESRKRPRSPDRYPVWCLKQRRLDPAAFAAGLGMSKDDACQIFTGAVSVSESKAFETVADGEASATEVAHSAASKICAAKDVFVERADDAALAFEMVKAYSIVASSDVEGDKSKESCGRECALLRAAAHETCKAQTRAWKAAVAARDALGAFCKAALAAEERHVRFRKMRNHAQQNAACALDMEVRYKDTDFVELPGGMCGVLDSPRVGDICRFFVRIIAASDDADFASWSCGFVTTIDVNESDTILDVKLKLQDKEGILPAKIALVYKGEKLKAQETLASYGIVGDDVSDFIVFGLMLPETLPLTPTAPTCPLGGS